MATTSSENTINDPPPRNFFARLSDEVDRKWTDIPVLVCCGITGLCDTVAFNAAGVFVGMQTGNTIFLALGAANLPPLQPKLWLKALVSIASFWLGCFVFGQFRRLGAKRKLTLALNFALQAAAILAVAIMIQVGAIPQFVDYAVDPDKELHEGQTSMIVLIPVALLAFQFGGQVVMSRVLGYNEVPTTVLTSLYTDLFSDPKLFAWPGQNEKRDRRVLAMITFLIGGVIGAWLQRADDGMPPPIWIAAGLKVLMAVAFLFWKSKEEPIPVSADGTGTQKV